MRTLNRLYRDTPALYEQDKSWDGFQWITPSDTDNSVLAFLRTDAHGAALLCVTNFTPVFHPLYRVGMPQRGVLKEILNTDRAEFGGSNQYNAYDVPVTAEGFNGFSYSAEICVPPLSCCYFRYEKADPETRPHYRFQTLQSITTEQRREPV